MMWRILPYAGVVHAFAGSWTTLMAATPANPANLCSLGFQVLGPGLAELAVAVLINDGVLAQGNRIARRYQGLSEAGCGESKAAGRVVTKRSWRTRVIQLHGAIMGSAGGSSNVSWPNPG